MAPDLLNECHHKPTGKWMVEDGKSYAECKKCGKWYQTTLTEPNLWNKN